MHGDPYEFWRLKLAGEDTSAWPAEVHAGRWRYRGDLVEVDPDRATWVRTDRGGDVEIGECDDRFREHVFGWAAADPVSTSAAEVFRLTGVWHDEEPATLGDYDGYEHAVACLCEVTADYLGDLEGDDLRKAEGLLSRHYEERRKVRALMERHDEWIKRLREAVKAAGGKVRP